MGKWKKIIGSLEEQSSSHLIELCTWEKASTVTYTITDENKSKYTEDNFLAIVTKFYISYNRLFKSISFNI